MPNVCLKQLFKGHNEMYVCPTLLSIISARQARLNNCQYQKSFRSAVTLPNDCSKTWGNFKQSFKSFNISGEPKKKVESNCQSSTIINVFSVGAEALLSLWAKCYGDSSSPKLITDRSEYWNCALEFTSRPKDQHASLLQYKLDPVVPASIKVLVRRLSHESRKSENTINQQQVQGCKPTLTQFRVQTR